MTNSPAWDRRRFLVKAAQLGLLGAAGGGVDRLLREPLGAAETTAGPIVETTAGRVRGRVGGGVHTLRGIPYGAPTGGANRFQPPRPRQAWTGVLDALDYGPSAPQVGRDPSVDEDCLVLNVWTPGLGDGGRRPVMVWLHGGGFSTGSGSSPTYDGTRLCRRGDVVVVTLNHRLNAFGSTYLAEIVGPDFAASGCAGILDIVAALEWVRDNIEAFGGDPGRVMIFGESGGGRKVSTLLAMPAAKGLFHAAVIQSGAVLRLRSTVDATAEAERLVATLGLRRDQARQLQSVPAELIQRAHAAVLREFEPGERIVGTTSSTPVLDGDLLPAHPFDPVATGVSADVPVIVGWNRTEETLFQAQTMELGMSEGSLLGRIAGRLGDEDQAERVVAAYRRAHPDARPWDLFILIATDHPRGMYPRELAARRQALGRASTWVYRFDWDMGGELKTPHALEIPFVFDNVGHTGNRLFRLPAEGPAQDLAARMSASWIAFARTGDPDTDDLPHWPAYDAERRATMIFDTESRIEDDPEGELRRVMEDVLEL
ncbi:MAG: carboxylesterase family protein [Thermoanaerobaculia bacterium]|nr:carboxylesterase family protein [Thermoanaerobaculia bacterium]